VLLCAVLAFGLLPGADAAVETLAATEVCADVCREHGCTALAHHCTCCMSAAALAPRAFLPELPVASSSDVRYDAHSDRGPPYSGVKPVLPPPIA
jgi:hypothetical protein